MRAIIVVLFATLSVSLAGNCVFSRVNFQEKATCRSGRLIEPHVSVKSTTEILDLSGNSISTLKDNSFYYVPIVMNLSLAHNSIHTIFLDAFSGLPHLKMINLSHNHLETFDKRIVEKNDNLLVLDVSENNFINLNGEPFLISSSLEELYMRNAKLVHLVEIFNDLPKLKVLDLSGNLLFAVSPPSFFTLTDLKFVNLQHNFYLKCDSTLQNLIEWFTKRDIDYESFKCVFPKKNSMFERMEMLPSLNPSQGESNESADEESRELDNLKESENTEDYDLLLHHHNRAAKLDEMYKIHHQRTSFSDCLEMDREFVCHLLMNCREQPEIKAVPEPSKTSYYLRNASLILFALGIFLGAIVGGVCTVFCAKTYKDCNQNLMVRQELRSIIRDAREDFSSYHEASRLNFPEEAPREQPQRQPRRPRRCTRSAPDPAQNTNRELIESNNAFHDFVSDLFSRRRRGQYLQTLQHRGSTLIRQMSRSTLNLFQRSNSQRATAPESPTSLEGIQLMDTDYRASTSNARSETPPPPYKDCYSAKA
ncbi:uncharacterized protein LOC132262924 [Phlebotomus argentipes]|uniref:uncharacterized protein LOC132262924 n=1 Tax=Phlebotomus argentipes TaxID=94469 RepID=UPI002892DFAB|nr:uncharacterized protein LOC132262924 [Phlebotomus argentipes]